VFTDFLATVISWACLLRDTVFTKALLGNAANSCLLLRSNRGIPCHITAAMVA
jgi:hypothetical protein